MTEEQKAVEEVVEQGQSILDIAPKLEKPWFFYPHLLKLNFFMLAPILAQIVSGYDGSMMNGLQSVESWQKFFGSPSGGRLGTMSNGTTIGTLISVPFVSYIVDFLGRKYSLIAGCVVIVAGAILQGACQNFSGFIGARILLGIGGCLSSTAASPLITECAYPTQRASVTAFLLASWPFGSFVAALVTRASFNSGSLHDSNWSWRIPSLLQGFFPLIQILIALFGPESPRWLVSKNRDKEARDFFIKYHANGDSNHLIVSAQMAEIESTIEEEKQQKISKWTQWLKTKGMRKRFFIVCFVPAMLQLEGNALISYYLHIILDNVGITDSIKQLDINLGLTVYSLIWAIAVASICDRFKRKTMFLTGLLTMFVVYVIWTILSAVGQQGDWKNHGLSVAIIVFIYLYNGFNNFCSCIGTPYVMELSPFSLRAKAASIYQLTGNVAGLFNNYVNPIAMVKITWKYYIVWCVWLVVLALIVFFFFPETQGRALEEVDDVIDSGYVTGRSALKSYVRDPKNEVSHVETAPTDV